jgi:hypothetical protein
MNDIRVLGTGRIRILPGPKTLDQSLTLCLERAGGHRVTLASVPTGQRSLIVAVMQAPPDGLPLKSHFTNAVAAGFALGSGVLWGNQPAPALGPIDQIGLVDEADQGGWRSSVLDRLEGRTVQLEAHPAACTCGRAIPIPRQRTATGQEAQR